MFLNKSRLFSSVRELVDGILKGDRSSLARGITLVESRLREHSREAQELFSLLENDKSKKSESLRIGISGSPGVGKSSLIEKIGMFCIKEEGLKVATLAIDPSSHKSGGSILGDKTRMSKLANNPMAFIRPSPSGGQLGGVARGTFSSIYLCEKAGFDVVFVESVGVGQSETQLADLTDIFVLCAAPMAGDDLQAMKRGISEMADLILLNKAEEPMNQVARKALMELKASQTLRSHPAQVIPVSALMGSGIKEAWDAMKKLQSDRISSGELMKRRKQQRINWYKSVIQCELLDRFDDYISDKLILIPSSVDSLKLSDEIIKDFCKKQMGVIPWLSFFKEMTAVKKSSKQKKVSGEAKNYISRGQAIKKLQVSLSDFRRLCILKGIYPRDPKNKKKLSKTGSSSGTYYWSKDIQFLLHEPLLNTLRETKSYAKKVARYTRKRDFAKVQSLEEHLKPQYSLDHLIKERYPTFADALRDLDDALSMLYLFAALPNTSNIAMSRDEKRMALAPGHEQLNFAHTSAALLREFEAYLIKERCVRRTFISIKGIYYQAEIMNQTVTWIVPHERTTPVPSDVDFRVMHTFLEFYQTLLGFVNFKLFSRVGWSYPLAPTMLRKSEADDESAQYRPVLLLEDLPKVQGEDAPVSESSKLFGNLTFFLSREVPRHSLALLIQSAGGSLGWECLDESSPISEDSPVITHHVIDRPNLAKMYADRVYIQPQWIFDSINAGKLLDPSLYRIGAQLPPHMSPFMRTEETETEVEASEEQEGQQQQEGLSAEQKKLAVSMLSKKKKKLYESMQRGLAIKAAEKERLEKRRAEIAATKEN